MRPKVSNIVQVVKNIRNPRHIRAMMGCTQEQMGEALALVHPNGRHGRPYSKSAICQWEKDRTASKFRMTHYTREAYQRVVADVVKSVDPHLELRARGWHFYLMRRCSHGNVFQLKYSRQKHSRRCRP